jgi:photosystem II stability/assembly factor-like uncharacterized protein
MGLALVTIAAPHAQEAYRVDPATYSGLQWRLLGPFRGGRVTAVTGVPGQPNHFYFGSVGGGVWETHNAGRTWDPTFDKEPVASIGAIEVAPSDPNVIYVGSGEADIRSSFSTGNGVYKSTDAGKTWTHLGLEDTFQIGSLLVDPTDPDVVYVAALGHGYAANPERGVFKSTDGGRTWKKVLYKNADTGAVALAFGGDSRTIFAALWQTRRPPWSVYPPSDGPGSGLYKSTDGGESWKPVTGHGFPRAGLGRIGLAVAPSNRQIVYANVSAKQGEGGLYRSDDGGSNWKHVTTDPRIWTRWWYFGHVAVDPRNADIVYVPNTAMYKSTNGGRSFEPFRGSPGGDDYQIAWVDPKDDGHMILGVDQGATITLDGGRTWSSWYNQPTGQFYHVTTDHQFPYRLYAAQQDSGAVVLPSRTDLLSGITKRHFVPIIAGAESHYVAPDPRDARYVYGTSFDSSMVKYDMLSAQDRWVSPTLAYPGVTYRKTWTLPAVFSSIDPRVLYYANQKLFRTDNGGQSWTIVSPDLTRENPGVPPNLDPVTAKDTEIQGPRRGVIYTIAPSPIQKGQIWAGTDDGLIWLTGDEGGHWQNVTPKGLGAWSKVGIIEASHFDANTAYAAVDRHRLDDYKPYIYVTHDRGESWKLAVNGIPAGDFVNVVREDLKKPGLLYAGAEKHVYVSFDGGAEWQSLQLNLPVTSMRDLDVHGDDLVLATFGRGMWILDDITALRQLDGRTAQSQATLFKPAEAYRRRRANLSFYGAQMPKDEPQAANPPFGAIIDYYLQTNVAAPVTLEIMDADGRLVRRYSSAQRTRQPDLQKLAIAPDWVLPVTSLSSAAGMHRFVWDLHYALLPQLFRHTNGEAEDNDGDGLWAPPGHYAVKLVVGSQAYNQLLEVRQDPRIRTPLDALAKQFDLARRIEGRRVELAGVSAQAQGVRKRLDDLRGNAIGSIGRQAGALLGEVDALAGVEPAANPAGSVVTPALEFPTTRHLESAYADLEASVQSAEAAPTIDEMRAFSRYEEQLNSVLAKWERLKNSDIPRLNESLKLAKLEEITISK